MYMRTHPQYGYIYNNGLPMALIHHIKIRFTCIKKKSLQNTWKSFGLYNRALIIESVSVISSGNKFKITSSHIKIHVPAKKKSYKYCWNVLFQLKYRSWKPAISPFLPRSLYTKLDVPGTCPEPLAPLGAGRGRVEIGFPSLSNLPGSLYWS